MVARAVGGANEARTPRAGERPANGAEHVVSDDTRARLRQRLDDYMAKKGLRSTAQRRLIVAYLQSVSEPSGLAAKK